MIRGISFVLSGNHSRIRQNYLGTVQSPTLGDATARLIFQIYLILSIGIYFTLSWIIAGQTLPLKAWRLLIEDASGRRLRLSTSLLRYTLAWASISLLGLGYLWIMIDPDRQYLHDRLSGTRIVVDRK